jgi:hypothetical protein
MKNKGILLGALILGASVFAAAKASAYPLFLTSASGTISYTPTYSNLSSSNATRMSIVAVNLKRLMTVVSNQVFLNDSTIVPKDAVIAYDPFAGATYLTNTTGYNHTVSGIVSVSLSDIATSFRKSINGVSENDKILNSLRVRGTAPDGLYAEFRVQGRGMLQFNTDKNNKGSMSISLPQGAGYGAYKGSDNSGDGVSSGSFTFRGRGTPEWSGAFSTQF